MEQIESPHKVFFLKFAGKIHQCFLIFLHFCFKMANTGQKCVLPPVADMYLMNSASSLATQIRKGKIKSVDLVHTYISRIKEVNEIINAAIEIREEEALKEARQADAMLENNEMTEEEFENEMPFLGVPISCKEIISVSGCSMTGGLVSRKGMKATDDSQAVKLMREAGAIPLAITNICELSMWTESHNKIYGWSCNPYDSCRGVGGSSGGEGALIGAGASVCGLGSDIAGSIRIPSCLNGIFGHKPTAGIVSNEGCFRTLNSDLDCFLTVGPMCRYATDLLPMLKVLASVNGEILNLDEQVNIRELKVYYMEDAGDYGFFTNVHPDVRAAFRKVLRHFKDAYNIVPQKLHLKQMRYAVEIYSAKIGEKGGFKVAEGMAEWQGKKNPLYELLLWFIGMSAHTLHIILVGIIDCLMPTIFSNDDSYTRYSSSDLLSSLEEKLGNDAIFLYPTWPEPSPFHNEMIFKPFNAAYTCLFNILGLPVTQCPIGMSADGLPIGIQVVANKNMDRIPLAVAVELEKVFGGWVCPSQVLE